MFAQNEGNGALKSGGQTTGGPHEKKSYPMPSQAKAMRSDKSLAHQGQRKS